MVKPSGISKKPAQADHTDLNREALPGIEGTALDRDETDSHQGLGQGSVHSSPAEWFEAPLASREERSGRDDIGIALDIRTALSDSGGSESIEHVLIETIPIGAEIGTIDPGSSEFNRLTPDAQGVVKVLGEQIDRLSIRPGENNVDDFSLRVTSTTVEEDGEDRWSVTHKLDVQVDAIADAPSFSTNAAVEDGGAISIALDLKSNLFDSDSTATLSFFIDRLPAGVILRDGSNEVLGDGASIDVSGWHLDTLSIETPPGDGSNFTLQVRVIATEMENGEPRVSIAPLPVFVRDLADTPTLTRGPPSGQEARAIAINLEVALAHLDVSELLSISVVGLPNGARFSDGSQSAVGDGLTDLEISDWDLGSLEVSPALCDDSNFVLTVTATDKEGGSAASTQLIILVDVEAMSGRPQLSSACFDGEEDVWIPIDVGATLIGTDDSESRSIFLDDMPTGVNVRDGVNLFSGDGATSLDLEGWNLDQIWICAPSNSGANVSFTVRTVATEASTGASVTTTQEISVEIDGAADASDLATAALAAGASLDDSLFRDSLIDLLDLTSFLADQDGSVAWTLALDGLPEGLVVSDGTFGLDNAATSTTVVQGRAVLFPIEFARTCLNGIESIVDRVDIRGLPPGTTLSAGAEIAEGIVQLTVAELEGLTLTPPANSDVRFELSVHARRRDSNGDCDSLVARITIRLDRDSDGPTVFEGRAVGTEDHVVGLPIDIDLGDRDRSGSVASIVIDGVPDGALLSNGLNNGDGSWTLKADQVDGLELIPSPDLVGAISLGIAIRLVELDGDLEVHRSSLRIDIAGAADAPHLSRASVSRRSRHR